MAQFTITIADEDVDRVITALCKNYGYHSDVPHPDFDPSETTHTSPATMPNPESRSQFANRMTRAFLMDHTVAYELQLEKRNVPQPTPPDITDPA